MAFELNYAVLSDPLQASIYITLSRRIAFQITLSEAFRCMAAGHLLGSTSTANIALASQATMNNNLTWQVGLRKSSALWTPKKNPSWASSDDKFSWDSARYRFPLIVLPRAPVFLSYFFRYKVLAYLYTPDHNTYPPDFYHWFICNPSTLPFNNIQ